MANDQINVPSLVVILVLSGLIVRYLFFSPPAGTQPSAGAGAGGRDSLAALRQREAAVERIQQMFPQVDRRTALWDLQRNGGNMAATTERILAGRMETPPQTFQPPPPPGSNTSTAATAAQGGAAKQPDKQRQPDLIQRYNLQSKLAAGGAEDGAGPSAEGGDAKRSNSTGGGKGWSSNKEERQSLLQKRREDMILAARRKMEAKLAAEKAAGS